MKMPASETAPTTPAVASAMPSQSRPWRLIRPMVAGGSDRARHYLGLELAGEALEAPAAELDAGLLKQPHCGVPVGDAVAVESARESGTSGRLGAHDQN